MTASPTGLLCVHAHPDDESISTGGVLARAAAEGRGATVVTCTGGEQGEVVGQGMDPAEVRPRLAEVRLAELRDALELLGAGEPRLLGYTDSGMLGEHSNDDPACFWQADIDEAVGRLVAIIRELRPQVLVTYDAYGLYGHPDHVQAHRVTMLASEASAVGALYPQAGAPWRVPKVYFATFPRTAVELANRELRARGLASPFEGEGEVGYPFGWPDEQIGAEVDVRPWLSEKLAALHAHRTQLGPDSFFLNVPEEMSEVAFGTEWFVRLRSDVSVPAREDDLFTGL